ncbi:MAG: flagellar hook-length control protein FliK [Desulfobacteraceae bacterium]|jgi:flagellar hook-length control protein FliK
MSTLPDINMLPTPSRVGTSEGFKPANSKGDDIFQAIFDSLSGRDSNSSWDSTLYSDNSANSSLNSGLRSNSENLNAEISSPGKNSSGNRQHKNEDLIVPDSLQNPLIAFLEKQGFSLKDINQVISSSKDSNGSIRLDKVLAGLSGISSTANKQGLMLVSSFKDLFSSFLSEQGVNPDNFGTFFSSLHNKNTSLTGNINDLLTGDKKDRSFIESSQIPGVQEILFKMGLGVGDVKKIIENSKNGKGELELGKLSAELNKYLSGPLSESDLISLFSKNNIQVNERLFNTEDSKTDAGLNLTDKSQKEIMQNIEAILKEKGIMEEDIKTLLEKLDMAFTKINLEKGAASGEADPGNQKMLSILKGEKQVISGVLGDPIKEDIAAFLKSKGASDRDLKSFLDSFSLKINNGLTDNTLKSSMLSDKVSWAIKNDPLFSAADQGSLKLNLTEILKMAERKANAAQLAKSAEGNAQTLRHGSAGKDSSDFPVKETQDISGLNISHEKEIKNIGKVNQPNTSASLPDPLPRIVDKMMIMIRTGEYKSRLQITPPDLGKLDIDLTIKNGHIHASLGTENAVVKEIIEANLNQLKQQLNDQGLTVDRFDVMVGLDYGEPRDSNTWAEGKNGKRPGRNSQESGLITDDPEGIQASQSINKNLIDDSQIDIHV